MALQFDTGEYRKLRESVTSAEMPLSAGDATGFEDWQNRLRTKLSRLVGGLDADRLDLDPVIHDSVTIGGILRETVTFQSRSGLTAFGYFLRPVDLPDRPIPAVLCLPGHGRGVDSIVGIAEDGSQRSPGSPDEYQMDFALQCAHQGYAVFALEQLSFGHRRDMEAVVAGPGASSCGRDSASALMVGETITGWRVWDAMRALDYLETREEVDSNRLATMGISGGGLTSFFTACLDLRVACCVVSGYFNTFRASILSINHCIDNFVPGILGLAEMPQLAGLIAPRLFFAESGIDDSIFPIAAFQEAVEFTQRIYATRGASERFGHEQFEGGHMFHGKGAFEFMRRHLGPGS